MSVADRTGFGPTRVVEIDGLGDITVTVTANKLFVPNAKPITICLTRDQYRRYLHWLESNDLIQHCLPDLSPGEREVLMSGLE